MGNFLSRQDFRLPARRRGRRLWLLGVVCAACGCATHRPGVYDALRSAPPLPADARASPSPYRVGSPDVLEVVVEGRPELSGCHEVFPDGCLVLGSAGRIRVEGLPTTAVEARLAERLRRPPAFVRVQVAEYRSQQVYLFGEVNGLQRAVAYQGPEPVADLLRRAGGITAGGAPEEVLVVRSGLMAKQDAAAFHVDLEAILLKGDNRTNVPVQPYDEIYVPETQKSRLGKCIHPWLRHVGRWVSSVF